MIDSYDSILLDLANDPRSEAVFATMSMQLKQNAGFDRVLALLNQLVDDGRQQLHVANKIWRKTEARCDVATMKFAERQSYYENRESSLNQLIAEMTKEKSDAASSEASMKVYNAWFDGFNRRNVLRKSESAANLNKRFQAAQEAVAETKKAIETVTSWTTRSKNEKKTDLQDSLKKVATAFVELKDFELEIPESFLELTANDHAVRRRLLEWLGQLRVTFVEIADHYEQKASARNEIFGREIEAVKSLMANYAIDTTHAHNAITAFTKHISSAQAGHEFVAKLSKQNAQLVIANQDYCRVEKHNYTDTKNLIDGQLVIFKGIKTYFINNYKKINDFIKHKYHKSD